MAKNTKTAEIYGVKYLIECHPYDEGAEIAWELQRLIGPHVIEYQKPTIEVMKTLTKDEQARLGEAKGAERVALFTELVQPKLQENQLKLMDVAQNYLKALRPSELARLSVDLFKYVTLPDGGELGDKTVRNLHFQGNYKPVVPLMVEVIQHNDFLELKAEELLQVQATRSQ